jgi:ribosomal protein L7/L12
MAITVTIRKTLMIQPELSLCKCCTGRVSREAIYCPHCGQPKPTSGQESWAEEVRNLVNQGNKIEAIKRVREATGMGLKEAKNYVDTRER